MTTAEHWEGVKHEAASEHRTTGGRAWCYQDGEWCYPSALCPCCYELSEAHIVCPNCDGAGWVLRNPGSAE